MRPTARGYLLRHVLRQRATTVRAVPVLLGAVGITGAGLLPWAAAATFCLLIGAGFLTVGGCLPYRPVDRRQDGDGTVRTLGRTARPPTTGDGTDPGRHGHMKYGARRSSL